MRNLFAALLLASLVFATGCQCGGYTGGGDAVLSNGTDSLTLCENGGFIANVGGATTEGLYTETTNASGVDDYAGTEGDDGQLLFDLTYDAGGNTATIPQFGDEPWQKLDLNQVELDHANIQCTDFPNRVWWTAQ